MYFVENAIYGPFKNTFCDFHKNSVVILRLGVIEVDLKINWYDHENQ